MAHHQEGYQGTATGADIERAAADLQKWASGFPVDLNTSLVTTLTPSMTTELIGCWACSACSAPRVS